jgi:tetratricopeptide (TPR) repeat protein
VLTAEGRLVEARALYEKALDVSARYVGVTMHRYARMLDEGADLAIAEGKPAAAAAIFERVLKDWPPAKDRLPSEYSHAVLGLAAADLELGRIEAARQTVEPLLAAVLAMPQPSDYVDLEAQSRRLLGNALLRSGRPADAEAHLRRAVEIRQSLDDPDSPWLAQARINLAACLIGRHQTREARGLLEMAALAQSHLPLLRQSYRGELAAARAMLQTAI